MSCKTSAIWALGFTLLFIFIYIAFRFHTWRLSFGAILAVLHDPILVLGIFSITQTPFDLAVVAAILAVIGYSLNDTVVVFDRIRERFETNRRLDPGAGARSVDQPDAVANHHDQGRDVDRGGGAAVPRRPGAARLLRGAADRHHRRHLLLDLHLERHRARLRPDGRARVPHGEEGGGSTTCPRRAERMLGLLDRSASLARVRYRSSVLEIVLGIDNIIFISILVGRLPPAQQERARIARPGAGDADAHRAAVLASCG